MRVSQFQGYGTKYLALVPEMARKIVPEVDMHLRMLKIYIPPFKVNCRNGSYLSGEDEDPYLLRIKK